MASEYDRKFEEMKNYVPFLESMIKRLENTSGSTNPRQAQLDKIRSLRDLLLDKKKRMKMENLLKCEQVLVNLYAKVEQRDTLPGIDLKVPSNMVKVKEEPDLNVVRNKLKIVTKMQEELPDTLPEIARANESQDTSTAGAKEPALFQRRPHMIGSSSQPLDSKNSQQKRNYTRVLVSPEPSSQRWSKQDEKVSEKPLFSRRSPRRQSPPHHKRDKKHSKQSTSPKSNLNITLKVPEERLDSLNTTDIFSRIINCSDNDVDIATLRELRSQIIGELKHTGAKDDISDLILKSSKKKKKKKSKRKEEVEEGELSDSESEAIENIYGSLVIVDKDQSTPGQAKSSNKQEQKPRKIQIRLVINSENEVTTSDSDKKGLISDLSELEMCDDNKNSEPKAAFNKEGLQSHLIEKETFDDEIAPKASELPDDEILQKNDDLLIENLVANKNLKNNDIPLETVASNKSSDPNHGKENISEIYEKSGENSGHDKTPFKPNFYKPLTETGTDTKETTSTVNVNHEDRDNSSKEKNSDVLIDKNESVTEKIFTNINEDVEKDVSTDVQIPLLNESNVPSNKTKENVVSEIDILQALKNEILSDSLAIPLIDQPTPALHQPKVTKVANTQVVGPKKRISIENYKQKASPKPVVNPLFTTQSSLKDKDDHNKKQSLKLTEKEYERFKFALDNGLSSDDDDIYEDLNKSDEDDGRNLAPKSPDHDESSNISANVPVIIPIDPIKNVNANPKADVDMRTLMPIMSPMANDPQLVKDNVIPNSISDKKQIFGKTEINRPSDPRLKRDSGSLNILNEPPKPVPPPLVGYPNVNSTIIAGNTLNLIPPLTPSATITPMMTPNRMPNMTPIRAPNMTPSMTPNSRPFEIDDQSKRKHVYASLYDTYDYTEDVPRQDNPRDSKWDSADERERNQRASVQDRQPKNRFNDSRSFYRDDNTANRLDSQAPIYRRTDAPLTPSHPFGRSDCPLTPSHPFGRSECPPTPSHPFGRSECPPTPSHPFGRSECPPTPSHPFGRLEGLPSHNSFSRLECPMTPSNPFGRPLECPATPSHSFGRSECPSTPSHAFGRSEMPSTPSHPFGRIDRDPRLHRSNDYENNFNDDRNRRYFKDQTSYMNSTTFNDGNNKAYNVDNYRNRREKSVSRNDRNRTNFYKEQNNRSYHEENMSRHESAGNRSKNYDNEQYNQRGQKSDGDNYHHDKPTRFRDVESRSFHQRERSIGRTNPNEERQIRSNSRARSVGRNLERDDDSFTIDTSVNATFQDIEKNNKEKSIFDQLFDRKTRASSVGRTFVRESSVGRTMTRPLKPLEHTSNTNDRLRRARSVVRDTRVESKSFSEIKADFESYRSNAKVFAIKRSPPMPSNSSVDRNSVCVSRNNKEIQMKRNNDSKQPYSPRKNYRDPRLNRDSYYDSRTKQKDSKHRYDSRDKKRHGIIYSNDNIASGTILRSGYGVKNYKIPKIKRPVEEVSTVTPPVEKTETLQNKQSKSAVKGEKEKTVDSSKVKETIKTNKKESNKNENIAPSLENADKRARTSNKKTENEKSHLIDEDIIIGKPPRSRKIIKDSESESEDNSEIIKKDAKTLTEVQKLSTEKKVDVPKDQGDSLDSSFGMDDMGVFSDNVVSDPVIDSINSLIADLDNDIKTSKNASTSFTNEVNFDNVLENITCSSATELSRNVSFNSELQKINKSTDNHAPQVNKDIKESRPLLITEKIKATENVSVKKTDDDKVLVDEKSEKETRDNNDAMAILPKHDASHEFVKDTDAIVSTTENVTCKSKDNEKQNNELVVRSTTPDSTNADTVSEEPNHGDSVPDSTEGVPNEVSEVTSSNTSAQLSSKDPELCSSVKEKPSSSDPFGNILSILQSKSKIKELLSMLGDQSSDNDKIKKKLEKLSEIVSDDEDTREDAEQESKVDMYHESRDGTEIDTRVNDDEESKDGAQYKKLIETKDKGDTFKNDNVENENINKIDEMKECENDESNTLETSTENVTPLDTESDVIALKQNKIVKKNVNRKIKMTKKRGKSVKKDLVDDKRMTRSDMSIKKSIPKKKVSRELLKLQEDIKEMFISDDVLNVTGIRMCRLAKLVDDKSQKEILSKSDTEPIVVLEKINKNESTDDIGAKISKIKHGAVSKKKIGPKSKLRVVLNESSSLAEDKTEKSNIVPKYKPGPKSKTKPLKPQKEVDPYDFETDSINESNNSKISEGSVQDTTDSESESLASFNSFGSSEALSELKPLSELKKKPKRKRSSWKAGVIKPKNKKKKAEQNIVDSVPKSQTTDETQHITIPDYNCFIDKKYCYIKNVFTYSCRLCIYNGEEIVAHYKKEHPHTEIPLSRLSPEVAKEAIEQCEEINFQAISKIPTDKYVCRFCYKEFGKKKAALESFFWHVVSMHTGEYKQICSECVNITRCPFNLDIPPPPKDIKGQLIGYICGKCNFTQISLENLKTHVIVRHNDEQTEVYTINLAVMSKKLLNILIKRMNVPETDQPRVLRSLRSNQSTTEMSDDRDDRSDAAETNSSFTEPETLKEEIQHRKVINKRKPSSESKSKFKSKITFENDDSASDSCNIASEFDSPAPVKIEREELDGENASNNSHANVKQLITATEKLDAPAVSEDRLEQPHFKVNYTEIGTGLELMCFINDCHYKSSTLRAFRSHVTFKHRENKWNGYCFICKDFVYPQGEYLFKDNVMHFNTTHVDSSRYSEGLVSEVRFTSDYTETGVKKIICTIEGHDYYECSTIMSLKSQVGTHKGKWSGYCMDCNDFVKPQGEYFLTDCLTHYQTKHNIDNSTVSDPVTKSAEYESPDGNNITVSAISNDIYAYPHFKITYTDSGSKEFVCCVNKKEGVHYKTPLLISLKRHVQTKHSENWDGYCFVCKVIVTPQGQHSFKDCLQHFLDKHMDDFPVLEKEPEPEKPVVEPPPRPYINVRPLSQLKDINTEGESALVLPKIESVVSLGSTSVPSVEYADPSEAEVTEPEPTEPEPETVIEEFHNYEASQTKVMSQKHAVVLEAMLRKEKIIKVFKCAGSFCSFTTDSADMALSHALTHQKIGGDNALCCSYCDFDCSENAIDLVVHVFKHANCPYSCGYCFYRAAAAQLVEAHSNVAHVGKPVKVYIANNAAVPEKDTAKMLTREAVVQYYVCNQDDGRCKFKIYTARKFLDHLQTRHSGEQSCYICCQAFPTATELIQHMKSHDLNLYQCTWCVHGADSEAELLAHAAARHPAHQPQAYLRIITNKDGSSEMRVLPLASFNKSIVGVEHVINSTVAENPVKEAERSIDLQKLIGQTKLMFETIASSSEVAENRPKTPNINDMATISPSPANNTPPRIPTPQTELADQPTPVLKSEPAEITPSKATDEVVCLDSDEEETAPSEERSETSASVSDVPKEAGDNADKSANTIDDYQVFKCPKCLVVCKTDTGLKLHILKCYNPNWPMACPHCYKMTKNREDLVQHYISDHCKKYSCAICGRETHSLKSANFHMKMIHRVLKTNVEYNAGGKHHVVHQDTTPGPKTPAKRKLPMKNVAAPPAKQPRRYGPQDVDRLPINPILEAPVHCSLCEFSTKVRLNMVRHLQLHAEQQPAPQTAPVNPVPHLETNEMHFDKMVNLASSSLAPPALVPAAAAARYPRFVPERQRYTCGARGCSYTSLDEPMLRRHWDTLHAGSTDYRCVHCPPYQHLDKSKPLVAARIVMHLKMHDAALYACSSCTYYHFKRPVVEKHINEVHKGNGQLMVVREETPPPTPPPGAASAPTMDLKPWQCGLCQFKSMLRPEVAGHCAKDHQSKMQFKCSYCPFRTSTLDNVVKHQTNSHPGRPEEVFYYYYREGSVADEDSVPKWVKQRQKMGITDDPVVKTEASDGAASKPETPPAVSTPVAVDLNIVKKEVEEKLDGAMSVEQLCRKFGQFCEPNGLKYKCCLCSVVSEDSREAMQSHLYEELQYRKWRCSICSYKAFHKNGLHEHIATEHRGRMQEPLPINLPVDDNIEIWVTELLKHQSSLIERNKKNLLIQKPQTPGPSGLNGPQKVPERPVENPVKMSFNHRELEEAFGPFGVANNRDYGCPKCPFRTEKEEAMREHLESELAKIRWCCSNCADNFQTYHEALLHCKSRHDGQSARPKEATRDPQMRAAWVTTTIQTQRPSTPYIDNTQHSDISLLKPDVVERNMQTLVGQKVQPLPSRAQNVEKPTETENQAVKPPYSHKELEDTFGQFGVAHNKEFCCPKCMFRSKSYDAMKNHLDSELVKIRWCCSNCPEKFQTYHEAQLHCKVHEGQARPREPPRDAGRRAAWVLAALAAQAQAMLPAPHHPPQDPDDSLLVVRYEKNVQIPEPSTSRPIQPPASLDTSASAESDDEKLVIDEEFTPKKVGKMTVCPHCLYQSKHRITVKDHMYRHFGLFPCGCGYCDFTGHRPSVALHLESIHPHEPKKFKVIPLPKGKPTILDVRNRRVRRKNVLNDWRFCLHCQTTFTVETAATHSHGEITSVFVKHGDIVVNCKVCQTFRKDFGMMDEHYATVHPDKPKNYFFYQILYNTSMKDASLPVFKRIQRAPTETIDLNDNEDDAPPPKKVARKSTTKLPMQAVAKKSTTKLPCLYISEDEEYSFYGIKPSPIESYENITTLMPFCNTMMPFTVKKLSEILRIDPRVVVKDFKK